MNLDTFDYDEMVKEAKWHSAGFFHRVLMHLRRLTGRVRIYVVTDSEGDKSFWTRIGMDIKTGEFTILGYGESKKEVQK